MEAPERDDSVWLGIRAALVSFAVTMAVMLCTGCTCNIAY